jgi:ubiquinone/menaquinone biosynthesis C-methylase UbiE
MVEQSRWQSVGKGAAEGYEQLLVPAIFAPWAPTLIEAGAVQPGESVLDVACGTGVVARLAASHVGNTGRVVGLDFTAAMLDVARSLPPVPGAPIEWCEASASAMPLPASSFDVVLCQQGVQQFSDRPAALREMHRVLHPGGRLAVAVWAPIERSPAFAALADALERHVGPEAANNRRATFAFGDAGALERLVTTVGFREVAVRMETGQTRFPSPEQFVQFLLASGPAAIFGNLSDETLAMVSRDVREAVGAYVTDDGLISPMVTNIALATK